MLLKLGKLRRLRVLSLSCNSLATLYTEFPRPDRRSSEIPRGEPLLPNLEELDLSFNDLREDTFLNLTVFTRLIKLNMAHNCVASIPVHLAASPNDFPFLTDLNLSHNDLVQYDQWKPLEGLPRLESLSLAHNRIRRVEPIDGVMEEAKSKRMNDVFRSLKWLDLSGNELRDLPRLHEHLSMLIGACDKTVVVKGNPLAEHPDFPEMAERLRPRSRSGKITFTARGPQAGTPPSQRKKPIRVFEDVPLRTIDARHGLYLARQARGRAEEQEEGILRRTEGLLNPELGEEDVALLMQARKRQIDDFVRDFEASLSRMGPDSFLAAAPFPLSESTQDALTELAARMGGGLDDDLGKAVVKEAGALTAKNPSPIVEASESSSGADAVVAVEPDGSQLEARAAIVKRRSYKPLAPKTREPTASDVAGAEEAMRLLREAESKLIMVSSSSICASTAAAANSAALASAASSSNVICRFGVIADVQYADKDDAYNFAKTKIRHYRKSVKTLGRAVDWWNSLRSPSVDFVVNLADLIDGHNRGTGTQKEAMATVMEEFERLNCRDKIVHMVGNHELYCFTRSELSKPQVFPPTKLPYALSRPPSLPDSQYPTGDPSTFYYSFVPCRGWRVVILEPYDLSVMREGGGRHGIELLKGHGLDPEGTALCQSHNPNDIGIQKDFFQGLHGLESRWVPFNGGFGKTQLAWLRNLLHGCHEDNTNVIVCSHVVIHPDATHEGNCRTLAWNYQDVLDAMYDFPCTKLVLCGHLHRETYHRDDHGIHHLCLPSPMEWDADECAITCDILSSGDIQVSGSGGISDRYFNCSD
ncbi:hypothetical protein FOZ63_008699 [Perkinsus olseni]|uniref:Calcineurin-like phosphoesterase domain-containing protein n=1 Tax=Perkinsus olseni TaxID=32597 RepID=A0A7J6SGC7_PEROL|nr:hypothetical protein FOZ63_008699 [Perkinsus olseni]